MNLIFAKKENEFAISRDAFEEFYVTARLNQPPIKGARGR